MDDRFALSLLKMPKNRSLCGRSPARCDSNCSNETLATGLSLSSGRYPEIGRESCSPLLQANCAAVTATNGLVMLAKSNGVSAVTGICRFASTQPDMPWCKYQPLGLLRATQIDTAGAIDSSTMCRAIRQISPSSITTAPGGLNTLLTDTLLGHYALRSKDATER